MVETKLKDSGVKNIIYGVALLCLTYFVLNKIPSIPFILLSLVLIINGIIEIKGYSNKKVYFTFMTVTLGVIWIFIFIYPVIPITNQITVLYNLFILGIITFFYAGYAYNLGNKMEKRKNVND